MTVCLNLLPDDRRLARARSVRIKRWMVGAVVYGLLLFVGGGLLRAVASGRGPGTASEIQHLQARIATVGDSISDLRSELGEYELTLTANRDLIEHPDWGLLLGLLAKTLGDDLVLRGCDVQRVAPPDAGVPDGHYQLVIRGRGRTQAAVSEFVLRLEHHGLFGEVKLVDTSLEPFLSGQSVAFHLECRLGGDAR